MPKGNNIGQKLPQGPAEKGGASSTGRHAAPCRGACPAWANVGAFSVGARVLLIISVLLPLVVLGSMMLVYMDPLGNMDKTPAVVVNLDAGAEIDEVQRNLGQELTDRLINGNAHPEQGLVTGMAWTFVSTREEADRLLSEGSCYFAMVIPGDFSSAVASAAESGAKQAVIEVTYNPALNYGTQEAARAFLRDVSEQTRKLVQTDWLDTVSVRISEAGTSLETLSNAGLDLTDGLHDAADGAGQLADGLDQLSDGASQLAEGVSSAASGAQQLSDGATELSGGVQQLADGLRQLKEGIEQGQSSPEAIALSQALADVGENLSRYGEEAQKENPDPAAEQAYLDAAVEAAKRAASANQTLGNPLVAYLSGGAFTYQAGGAQITSTEQGLIPALAAYAKAQAELEEFQSEKLDPLLKDIETLEDDFERLGEDGKQAYEDLKAFRDAVEAQAVCGEQYRRDLRAYRAALTQYQEGTLSWEELQASWDQAAASWNAYEQAGEDLRSCREALSYDLYHENPDGTVGGLLPTLREAGETAGDLFQRIGSLEELKAMVSTMMTLISNQAQAGAAVAGAAGKCQGYLVGVAVTSSYTTASTAQLAQAIGTIYVAVAGGPEGGQSLLSGTQALAEGAGALSDGLTEAADGGWQIALNLRTVAEGQWTLAEGLGTASDTAGTLFSGLADSQKAFAQASDLGEDQLTALAEPVTVRASQESLISTLGTSTAPYYLLAGLWAGCALAALALLQGMGQTALRKSPLPLMAVALLQVVLGLVMIQAVFGIQIDHVASFYGVGVVAAVTFAIINWLLVGWWGLNGMAVSLVLLVLQLALSAAYFPLQTAAIPLLSSVAPFLPLPQAVAALRIAMRGLRLTMLLVPLLVVLAYGLAPWSVAKLAGGLRQKKGQKQRELAGGSHA